jgi:hypothetical protein
LQWRCGALISARGNEISERAFFLQNLAFNLLQNINMCSIILSMIAEKRKISFNNIFNHKAKSYSFPVPDDLAKDLDAALSEVNKPGAKFSTLEEIFFRIKKNKIRNV